MGTYTKVNSKTEIDKVKELIPGPTNLTTKENGWLIK
jgi:hypothetical protein